MEDHATSVQHAEQEENLTEKWGDRKMAGKQAHGSGGTLSSCELTLFIS